MNPSYMQIQKYVQKQGIAPLVRWEIVPLVSGES